MRALRSVANLFIPETGMQHAIGTGGFAGNFHDARQVPGAVVYTLTATASNDV